MGNPGPMLSKNFLTTHQLFIHFRTEFLHTKHPRNPPVSPRTANGGGS